ncbi:MAG: CPBP family intramembrane metalloprotease [archaeon]|nr:CPBP family intramembrane metalloprotease [archaeon]
MNENNNNPNDLNNETNGFQINSKEDILKFCPNCGIKIKWAKNLKFCNNCGISYIQFIPRKKISEWLSIPVSDSEISQLYSSIKNNSQFTLNQPYYRRDIRPRKQWNWKAALGVPLLAYIAKFIFIIILLIALLTLLVTVSGDLQMDELLNLMLTDENMLSILTIIDLFTQLIFLIIPYVLVKRYLPIEATKQDKWNALGIPIGKITPKEFLKEFIIGTLFAVLMTIIVLIVQEISAFVTYLLWGITRESLIEQDISGMGMPTTIGMLIIYIILMFISIGPSEEVIFRGFCQKGLEQSFGKKSGWLLTAIYFSIFHIYVLIFQPPIFFFMFFPYLVISLLLGFLYLWRKNLVAAIIAHALYNSIQFIMIFILIG